MSRAGPRASEPRRVLIGRRDAALQIGTPLDCGLGASQHLGRTEPHVGQLLVDGAESRFRLVARRARRIRRSLPVLHRCDEPVLLGLDAGERRLERADLGTPGAPSGGEHAEVEGAQLVLQAMVLLRPLGLALQRRHLPLELPDHVLNAQKIVARALHLPLRGDLPSPETRRARRLLDEVPELLGLRVDELLDPTLLDDRVGLRADPGAEEELGDVLQAARRLVDEVLRLAGAKVASRDEDLAQLRELGREPVAAGAIVAGYEVGFQQLLFAALEQQRDLRHAERSILRVAREDDVLHRGAAEVLRALLAQDPADRVDDVRLAATVGTDDRRHTRRQLEHRALHERLEAVQLDLLDPHPLPLRRAAPPINVCGRPRTRRAPCRSDTASTRRGAAAGTPPP